MDRSRLRTAACLLMLSGLAADASALSLGNINVFLGGKTLRESDWQPADEQREIGVEFDIKEKDWPVSIALDLFSGGGEGSRFHPVQGKITTKSRTTELDLGVRKIFEPTPTVRPFLGGGLSLQSAEARVTRGGVTTSDDDDGNGLWVSGGVYFLLSKNINLGIESRFSSAKVEVFGSEANSGGNHLGLLVGYHFGDSSEEAPMAETAPAPAASATPVEPEPAPQAAP